MAITLASFFTNAYTTFKTVINTSVVDPQKGVASSNRRWIYRDFPDTTSLSQSGYPLIHINHADFNDDNIIVLNDSLRENVITFDVDVYAEFDDVNGRNDTVSSGVLEAIFDSDNVTTMEGIGLFTPKIVNTTTTTTDIDGKQVVLRSFRISYTIEVGC